MGYKVVLFDLDGTIIDTMGAYARLAAKLLSEKKAFPYDQALRMYLETAGRPFIDQLRIMGVESDEAEHIYREFIEEKKKVLAGARVSEEVRRFVDELVKAGIVTAVSTNNECEVVSKIKGLDVFHVILCFDGRRHRKGKEHVATLKTLLGEVDEIVFVGDSPYDIKLHRSLGLKTVRTRGLFIKGEIVRVRKELQRLLGVRL